MVTIRQEKRKDYKSIVTLILRSFQEETDYSDGTAGATAQMNKEMYAMVIVGICGCVVCGMYYDA